MKDPFGVTKAAIDRLASAAVHGVIDGGYSDGTGLGIAVAEGAEEVLLVLNSATGCSTCSPFFVEMLCKHGPRPANPLIPTVLFPLFETNASEVRSAWSAFHHLTIPDGTKFLKTFAAGSIQMTTADNRYFGIVGGRNVTVHMIHVCSSLDI